MLKLQLKLSRTKRQSCDTVMALRSELDKQHDIMMDENIYVENCR